MFKSKHYVTNRTAIAGKLYGGESVNAKKLKMMSKKLMLGLVALLFVSSIVGQAFADPELGLVTSNKRKNIVRDPLVNSGGATSGWVTFPCQSLEGFQYSVAVKGLSSHTTYEVWALSLPAVYVPELSTWLPTSDGGGVWYALGIIHTNGKGEGEVTGLIPLPATHLFLPFGLYGWVIIVFDPTEVPVLWSPLDDPVDFAVFPAWP